MKIMITLGVELGNLNSLDDEDVGKAIADLEAGIRSLNLDCAVTDVEVDDWDESR